MCLEPVNGFKYLAASRLQWTELIDTFRFLLLKLPIKQLDDTTLYPAFSSLVSFTRLVEGNSRSVDCNINKIKYYSEIIIGL